MGLHFHRFGNNDFAGLLMKFILKQKEKSWGLWFGIYLLTTGSHLELLHAKAILEAAFARVKAEPVADATGCSHSDKENLSEICPGCGENYAPGVECELCL